MAQDPDMIEVFSMLVYDSSTDTVLKPASKRTKDDIIRCGCEVIGGTGEMVHLLDLDAHGRYYPKGAKRP